MYCFRLPLSYQKTWQKDKGVTGPISYSPKWNYLRNGTMAENMSPLTKPEGISAAVFDSLSTEGRPPEFNDTWKIVTVDTDPNSSTLIYDVFGNHSIGLFVEVVSDRLFFYAGGKTPKPKEGYYYFATEGSITYSPYHLDFGPYSIGSVYSFIEKLSSVLFNPKYSDCRIVYMSSPSADKVTNAITLLALFLIDVLSYTTEEALTPFKHIKLKPFRDASYGATKFDMYVKDVLNGFLEGKNLGWYNTKTFDLTDYTKYESIYNGDMNWIVPGEIIAFSSPADQEVSVGYPTTTTRMLTPIFKAKSVSTVVRLNDKQYDESVFVKAGLDFHELYFPDGSCPPAIIIEKFLDIMENAKGVVAIHCKAGLGRTGSLIGCYCMKKYRMNSRAFLGWVRLMRPGSILGPQQAFLVHVQSHMHEEYDNNKANTGLPSPTKNAAISTTSSSSCLPSRSSSGVKPKKDLLSRLRNRKQADAAFVDQGQGERLMGAKGAK